MITVGELCNAAWTMNCRKAHSIPTRMMNCRSIASSATDRLFESHDSQRQIAGDSDRVRSIAPSETAFARRSLLSLLTRGCRLRRMLLELQHRGSKPAIPKLCLRHAASASIIRHQLEIWAGRIIAFQRRYWVDAIMIVTAIKDIPAAS